MPSHDLSSIPITEHSPAQGWVLYDGDCGICMKLIRSVEPILIHYGFTTLPLQTAWVKETLGLARDDRHSELLKEMRLLTPTRDVYGGADALLAIARRIWWASPLYGLAFLPGVKPLLRKGYQWVAERRHCSSQGCALPKK